MRTIYKDGRWRTQSATKAIRERQAERDYAAERKSRSEANRIRREIEQMEEKS